MKNSIDGYQLLCNAIILRAVEDYKNSPQKITRCENKLHKLELVLEKTKQIGILDDIQKAEKKVDGAERSLMLAKQEQHDIERFFRSSWYQMLTNVDSKIILDYLHKEVRT